MSKKLVVPACFAIQLLLLLALTMWRPHQTPVQQFYFRLLAGLSGAGLAAIIPGQLKIDIRWLKNTFSATGAIGVFLVVFLYTPSPIPEKGDELPYELKGQWFYNAVTRSSTVVHGGSCVMDTLDGHPHFQGLRQYTWQKDPETGKWTLDQEKLSWESDWFVFRDPEHFFFHYHLRRGLAYVEGICYGTVERNGKDLRIEGDILGEINTTAPLAGRNLFARADCWKDNRDPTRKQPLME